MPMARILKNYNLFVNGRGKAGVAEEFTPPEIKVKTDGHRAGGLDAEVDIDMGMEKMRAKFKISDPDPDTLVLVGLAGSNTSRVIAKGAYRRDSDTSIVQEIHEMVGRVDSATADAWKTGDKGAKEFEMSVNYYKLTIGGRDIYEIDIENMIRRVDGVDQLADIRNAIGI